MKCLTFSILIFLKHFYTYSISNRLSANLDRFSEFLKNQIFWSDLTCAVWRVKHVQSPHLVSVVGIWEAGTLKNKPAGEPFTTSSQWNQLCVLLTLQYPCVCCLYHQEGCHWRMWAWNFYISETDSVGYLWSVFCIKFKTKFCYLSSNV